MGATLFSSCLFSLRHHHQSLCRYPQQSKQLLNPHMAVKSSSGVDADAKEIDEASKELFGIFGRRRAIISGFSLIPAVLGFPSDGLAIKQGLLAGRIPGLSDPDDKGDISVPNLGAHCVPTIVYITAVVYFGYLPSDSETVYETGWRTYRRPDEKSGGHGVGWSPIIPYMFKVPGGWEEVPVSIADLGGTEIDLRFANSQEGRLFVIVAPVLRFSDLGGDAKIEEIGPPERVINAFGPEVIGENVEGKVLSMDVAEHLGRMYYQYELEPPHVLITATAAGNRLYLFNVTASGLQWKRHYKDLKQIADSFRVV